MGPIMVMLREHAQMWQTLDLVESLLGAHAPDVALQNTCRELFTQLRSHNPKEEQILYPQADDHLSPSEQTRLRAFSDSGQIPEGWTCAGLRA
jgi:iron-sulfur cluster repair protein YtfE (RIC family)